MRSRAHSHVEPIWPFDGQISRRQGKPGMISFGADPADVIVIGGGPAGSAAAITAAQRGLKVALVEAAAFPRFRPGETLADAVQATIETLIGPRAFASLPIVRYPHIRREERGLRLETGALPGFNVLRSDLDAALLEAASASGVQVLQPACAMDAERDRDGSWRVRTTKGVVFGRFLIDGSGVTEWLSRRLGNAALPLSQPLKVTYRYDTLREGDGIPRFQLDQQGWTWDTALPGDTHVTAAMYFHPQQPSASPRVAAPVRYRRANCTWRLSSQLAGGSFALVGDAACQVDPAASQGVWRALSSGIAVGEVIGERFRRGLDIDDALLPYCRALSARTLSDCARLNEAYRRASGLDDPVGFGRMSRVFD